MEIRLLYEIHSTGFEQLLKTIDELREVILTVLDKRTGEAIRDAESPVVLADEVQQQIIGRKITFVCHLLKYLLIEMLVKIRGMYILCVSYVKD